MKHAHTAGALYGKKSLARKLSGSTTAMIEDFSRDGMPQ